MEIRNSLVSSLMLGCHSGNHAQNVQLSVYQWGTNLPAGTLINLRFTQIKSDWVLSRGDFKQFLGMLNFRYKFSQQP